MSTRAEFINQRRREAWDHGRRIREKLLAEYCTCYGLSTPPAPARVIGELLTDLLEARLAYDPLPSNEFARTEWKNGRPFVTINSLTSEIEGVKNIAGTQNVAAWHEAIHVVDHSDVLQRGPQGQLTGFDVPEVVVCHRAPSRDLSPEQRAREFWAEEAGRAAAVSLPELERAPSFQELLRLGVRSRGRPVNGFPLLYDAADFIAVNIAALVKQLEFEGKISVVRESGRRLIVVQQALLLEVG